MDKNNRSEDIAFVLAEYALTQDNHRDQLMMVFDLEFGLKGELTEEKLQAMDESGFRTIVGVMKGLMMTREYVPDIINAYSHTDVQYLQSQVSFGYHQEEEPPLSVTDEHYGAYEVPPTMRKLIELEQEMGKAMDRQLGLCLTRSDFRYISTPPDFIPFATPGVDGIHYCFATDFGSVPNLEEANIAVVSPMDFGDAVWFVARNLHDFLRIVCTDGDVLYNNFKTRDAYLAYTKRREAARAEPGYKAEDNKRVQAHDRLRAAFGLSDITDLADYMDGLKRERMAKAAVMTRDTIGVMPLRRGEGDGPSAERTEPPMIEKIPQDERELTEAFAKAATSELKLAIVRELQYDNALYDNQSMLLICMRELERLGLRDERNRLEEASKRG
ncbi:hypothetical protein [Paenibacillus sp. NPDC058071]|uniref:hypothetical protein n=1 Tax=Paenibacillus sp. NPDC058071 TaxID=3346326 RepID=UPI0036DF789B